MNGQIKQRRLSSLLAAAAAVLLCGAFSQTFAQAGVGAKFGARDPHLCKDRTQPRTGGPSAQQAKEYFICDSEYGSDETYFFVEDVTVQVGPGRPYNPHDVNFPNIDIKYPVYPIRGSFTSYICGSIYLDKSNLGRNCNTYAKPNAVGACYKDMFGDWHCGMTDDKTGRDVAANVAPPGGPAQPNKPANKQTPPNNPAQRERPAGNKGEQNDKGEQENEGAQNAGGFPKPDFAAISDTYDLVKYEYDSPPGWLSFTVKVKKETSPVTSNYTVHFLDEDGAEVANGFQTTLGGWGHPGDVLHFKVAMPYKNDMLKVKKVVFRP